MAKPLDTSPLMLDAMIASGYRGGKGRAAHDRVSAKTAWMEDAQARYRPQCTWRSLVQQRIAGAHGSAIGISKAGDFCAVY